MRDYIQFRGRWKGNKKQVDTYIDINRPFPDALLYTVDSGWLISFFIFQGHYFIVFK